MIVLIVVCVNDKLFHLADPRCHYMIEVASEKKTIPLTEKKIKSQILITMR